MSTGLRPVVAAALLSLAVLAGCSSDGSPADDSPDASASSSPLESEQAGDVDPAELLQAARAAARGAESVRFTGSFDDDEDGPGSLDLRAVAGRGGNGTASFQGYDTELVVVDGTFYAKAPVGLWAEILGDATLAAQFADRWVVPTDEQSLAFGFFPIFIEGDLDALFGTLGPEGDVTVGSEAEFNGESAVPIIDAADDSLLWIATEGEPYPLGTEGSPEGDVIFSEWNEPVELIAPAEALDASTPG